MKSLMKVAAAATLLAKAVVIASNCKTFPTDSRWPSSWSWKALNFAVDDHLIETVPLASPCHDPNFDAQQCEFLQSQWQDAEIQ